MADESEFGKGLVLCLVKFAEHRGRMFETKVKDVLGEPRMVELLMNGASDHLYDIEVPPLWVGSDIETKVKELQDRGLEMGHGISQEHWTEKDAEALYELCQEIALMIDKRLGIFDAQKGRW